MTQLKVYTNEFQQDIDRFFEKSFIELGWRYEPYGRHSDIANIQESYMSKGCFWCMYDDSRLIGTVGVRVCLYQNNIDTTRAIFLVPTSEF